MQEILPELKADPNFAHLKNLQRIAVFASGSGSNAEVLIKHFHKSPHASVALVVTNRKQAGVIGRANKLDIPVEYTSRKALEQGNTLSLLKGAGIDLIVLAGFLLRIPSSLISAFPDGIINIHPSLLPKFGGEGMYGQHVHEAVLASGNTESGISIHLVNENYDDGRVLGQFTCPVNGDDSVESLQKRIQTLEHAHFPQVIEEHITRT